MSDEKENVGADITLRVWFKGFLWLLMACVFLLVCGTACLSAAYFDLGQK